MDLQMIELQKRIDVLTEELAADRQKYQSAKQSLNRMSARLRKLCKRLTPTSETVLEMQKIAAEIRDQVKTVT